jgi:hypothetical protein
MGRDTGYWSRPGVLVGEGRVSFRDVSALSFVANTKQ